jgi:PAS domain S-box-containing protein
MGACVSLVLERTVLVLTIMFCVAGVSVLFQLSRLSSALIQSATLQGAALYSELLTEIRALYTAEVVARVTPYGIVAAHDYAGRDGAIPLPATFTMKLGERIGNKGSGMHVRLYSNYPFPWRSDGGPHDDFEREALRHLLQEPNQPFVRYETVDGRPSLRYATADRMQAACVHCHNTNPQSPKTDWKEGDVRGVLEIIRPIDAAVAQTRAGLAETSAYLAASGILGLFGLGLVIGRVRRQSAQLQEANQQLRLEIAERNRAEAALRLSEAQTRLVVDTAHDAFTAIDAAGTITDWNRQAEVIFGWSRAEALGRPLTETIIPLQYRDAHKQGLRRFLATGEGPVLNRRIEITALHRNNHEFPVELSITPIPIGETYIFNAFVHDITERKHAEIAREEEGQISAALARVGRDLISSFATPQLLERLCELTAAVLRCDYSVTWSWRPEEQVYVPIACHGLPTDGDATCAMRLPSSPSSPLLTRLASEDVIQFRGSSAEDPHELLGTQGYTLALCIALRRGDEIAGIQAAGYRNRLEPFTPAQKRIAQGIGQLASMALTNARLVQELERASRLKSEFMSTMSHELRTPLNVIVGYTDMLTDDLIPAERAHALAQIRLASLDLLEMIEATLDLNRIGAGKDVPHFAPVSLQPLWEELSAEFAALPRRSELVLRWEPVDELELCTDRRKLKTILKNLVGNALKFTVAGEIVVSGRRSADACMLVVRDTGIGIPPEHLPLIFEMFQQVDSSDTRSYAGAGLGLYIVRCLLDQLGGKIGVESERGRGSIFCVTLPVAPPTERALEFAREPVAPRPPSGIKEKPSVHSPSQTPFPT